MAFKSWIFKLSCAKIDTHCYTLTLIHRKILPYIQFKWCLKIEKSYFRIFSYSRMWCAISIVLDMYLFNFMIPSNYWGLKLLINSISINSIVTSQKPGFVFWVKRAYNFLFSVQLMLLWVIENVNFYQVISWDSQWNWDLDFLHLASFITHNYEKILFKFLIKQFKWCLKVEIS